MNVAEASRSEPVTGEGSFVSVGVRSRGMYSEKHQELGRPVHLLEWGRSRQLKEGALMGGQESDPLIVLRGGRADHMGKRRAGWLPGQSTHPGENDCLASKLAFDVVSRTLSKLLLRDHPEEPCAGKPHAGICEGAAR